METLKQSIQANYDDTKMTSLMSNTFIVELQSSQTKIKYITQHVFIVNYEQIYHTIFIPNQFSWKQMWLEHHAITK